jgi:adenylate cyclase
MQRRLAAVLAADVAGYSELMGDNTEATLTALRRLRAEVFGPTVAARRGRVVKSMGDGWIVLFPAAVDAARCALQIQELLSSGLSNGERKLLLRLGIHLGDVVEDEEDIFGDGINIAARLEELAFPGSIAISDAVFCSLDGTLRPSFDDAGERKLRNISRPVKVWVRGSLPAGAQDRTAQADRPHIVIRPVETSDTRAQVLELADALTGDVVTCLGATHWLTVTTGATAAPAYRLTARLRASGARLRLDTKLTGPAGQDLWSAKIDGNLDDAFDWQDSSAETLVSQVLAAIFEGERRNLDKLTVAEMSANQCELRGQLALDRMDPQAFASALRYSAAAIDKDPSSPHALALGLVAYLSSEAMGYDDVNKLYAGKIPRWCAAATRLASDHALLNLALGVTTYAQSRDPVALRQIVEKALRRSSSDFITLALSGWAYIWIGDHESALDCLTKAWTLGRQSPWALSIKGGLALASVLAGDDRKAVAHAQEGLKFSTDYATLHRVLAAAQANSGRLDAARHAVETVLRMDPDDSITAIQHRNVFADPEGDNRYIAGLRAAGMPEQTVPG